MNPRRPDITSIWRPARGRHRATIVEARRRPGGKPRRSPWLPALAASRERLATSPNLARSV
jgi:hypothetical protein